MKPFLWTNDPIGYKNIILMTNICRFWFVLPFSKKLVDSLLIIILCHSLLDLISGDFFVDEFDDAFLVISLIILNLL